MPSSSAITLRITSKNIRRAKARCARASFPTGYLKAANSPIGSPSASCVNARDLIKKITQAQTHSPPLANPRTRIMNRSFGSAWNAPHRNTTPVMAGDRASARFDRGEVSPP